jgi:hypothetical protein
VYLLDDRHPTLRKFVLAGVLGVILAPVVAECVAPVICAEVVGGAINASIPEGAAMARQEPYLPA